MDRAGKKAQPLSRDELEAIFQAVHEGEEWQEARKRLPNRDRVTVRKAYKLIQQFEVQRPTRLDDTSSGQMAEAAGYGATVSWVQRVFVYWRDWARTGNEDQEFGPRPKERARSNRDSLQVEVGPLSHSRRPGTIREYSSAWVIDITLTNPSQEFPVGIKSFVLETIRRGREDVEEAHILHHIGKDVQGSHGYVPFSDSAFDESIRIEPVTTIKGKLRFIDLHPFDQGTLALALTVEESEWASPHP